RIVARQLVEQHTDFNIELIELLSDNHLKYEKSHTDFKLTEF
ncbi:RNA polymerase epsilon subunit, partial [Streptococcus pyogenes]